MNRMRDTAILPDLNRIVYLVKKDRKGYNDWYELKPNACDSMFPENWFKQLCDKNKFFAWSYYPYGVSR